MASTAVDLLIGSIASALQNEARLLGGLHDELDDLKLELETMNAFLEDIDEKNLQSKGENNRVEKVREMAHNIEVILDEFMYRMNWQPNGGGRLCKSMRRTIRIPKNLWEMHTTANKVLKIKKNIRAIDEINQRYRVDHAKGGSSSSNQRYRVPIQREGAYFLEKDELVDVEDESHLYTWLMDGGVNQRIMSVVGMGGSGKTTLVGKIYKDDRVKKQFDCHAWITFSQSSVIEDLMRNLIKEFYKEGAAPEKLNSLDYRELAETLVIYLKMKRYLVVLDDVWDTGLWEQIKESLPRSSGGSRIVLTTRKEDVASQSDILLIKPLAPEEAWRLFCMKAFFPDKTCPGELKNLAQELMSKCERLPLAVANLGGLMSSKKSVTEWRNVCNSLNWELSNNPKLEAVKTILLLSFKELSPPLKRCFLYCCLFPASYPIRRKRLIKLWLAEGFVQVDNRIPMEDLAEKHLMELIYRSMLQVVTRNEYGRPKACKMHDLLREVALSVSEEEKFCAVYDGRVALKRCNARRLSVQTVGGDFEVDDNGMSQLRSFFGFVYDCQFPPEMLSKFKLLSVLDLQDVPIDKLPNELGILFNLTYLNLRSTRVAELPESIGKLRKLQSLDIRDSKIEELPKSAANLENLVHLIMYRYNVGEGHNFRYVNGTRVPFNISKLKKLQASSSVDADGDIIRQLRSMTQLTRIGISNLTEAEGKDLCSSIQKLKKLHYLFLMARGEEESLGLDSITSPPPYLRVLILAGKLARVPKWFSSLESVTNLYLHWPRLTEDVLPHIAGLPNLGSLCLVMAFLGSKLHFSTGFTKLTFLSLSNFPQLTEIVVENGVMPDIQKLRIRKCPKLEFLHGTEYLTNLQELIIPSECEKLIDSLKADFWKVQHIWNIFFW